MADICAVWCINWRGEADYWPDETEEDAARYAVAMEDSDYPSAILGIQFADGRLIRAAEWEALAEARRRQRQREQERRDNPPAPPPTRKAVDPFDGLPVDIELSEPGWLGRSADDA